MQEQINQYRDEAAKLRLDNAKLASKVTIAMRPSLLCHHDVIIVSLLQLEHSNERYEMLDSTHKGLKTELSALRDKEKKVSSMLTRHQVTVDRLTQELLAAREQNS